MGSSQVERENMIDRISNCDALLKRNEIEPFLKRVITGDKKMDHIPQSEDRGKGMVSRHKRSRSLIQFCNQKPQKFFTDGIMGLPEKWRNVVDKNGACLV